MTNKFEGWLHCDGLGMEQRISIEDLYQMFKERMRLEDTSARIQKEFEQSFYDRQWVLIGRDITKDGKYESWGFMLFLVLMSSLLLFGMILGVLEQLK